MSSQKINLTAQQFPDLDLIGLPVLIIDHAFRILYANQKLKVLLESAGTGNDIFPINSLFSVFQGLDEKSNEIAPLIADEFHEGQIIIHTMHLNNQNLIFDLYFSRYKTNNVKGDFFLVTCLDVTEREAEFMHHKEISEQHTIFLDHTTTAVIIHQNGIIKYSNARADRLAGAADGKSITGMEIWQFVSAEFRTIAAERIKQILQGGGVAEPIEERFIRIDGLVFDVEVLAFPVNYQGGFAIKTMFNDITERKTAERKLLASRQQYYNLVENLNDVVFQTDENAVFIYLNSSWEKLTGYAIQETLGKSCFEFLFHPYDTNSFYQKVRRLVIGGVDEFVYDLLLRHKNGEKRYVEVSLRPVIGEENIITGISGLISDIHQKKLADMEVKEIHKKVKFHQSVLLNLTKDPAIISGDFNTAIKNIAFIAASTLKISSLSIWRFTHNDTQLDALVNYNNSFNVFEECVSLKREDYPVYFDSQLREAVIAVEDVYAEPLIAEFITPYLKPKGIVSLMDVIISRGEEIFGVICFEQTGQLRKWSVEEQSFARSLADFISLAYETHIRSEIQNQLLESEKRLEMVLKGADVGTWDYDFREDRMVHNKRWAEMLGYSFEHTEVNLQFGEKLVHPDDLAEAREIFRKHVSGETPVYETVYRMLSSSGEWRYIQDKGRVVEWDREGKPLRASGIQLDITPLKLYEQQIIQQRIFLNQIINAIPNLIYVKNKNQRFVVVNNAFAGFLGEDPESLMHYENYDAFIHRKTLQNLFDQDDEIFISGKPVFIPGKEIFNEFTGVKHWMQMIKVPLLDANGTITEILSVATDITELKHNEYELEQLNNLLEIKVKERTAMLESANTELETFNYSVSHDLRTPLRTIDIFAYFLEKNYSDKVDAEGLTHLNQIRSSIIKMSNLIDNLLIFSKIGKTTLSVDTIAAETLIEDVLAEFQETTDISKVEIRIGALPEIKGDYFLMRQAFINLISNAIKFTRTRVNPLIVFEGYTENNAVVISIADNGVGFSMELKDKLFQAFKRLHSDEKFEGTGVGLAIVERIIKRHNGKVWAESEEDKGSVFYLQLPA